jgi:hypothetical protein
MTSHHDPNQQREAPTMSANHPDNCWCLSCAADDPPTEISPLEARIFAANFGIWVAIALVAVLVLRGRSFGAVMFCLVMMGVSVAWAEWRIGRV